MAKIHLVSLGFANAQFRCTDPALPVLFGADNGLTSIGCVLETDVAYFVAGSTASATFSGLTAPDFAVWWAELDKTSFEPLNQMAVDTATLDRLGTRCDYDVISK